MTFGVDLSHHQDPAAVPWDHIAASSSFCICRATYGCARDRHVAEHLRRARSVGLQVGVYGFFRVSQPVEDQIAAFRAAAQASGYQPGDIIPALDVEADPIPKLQAVAPSWEPAVKRFADALTYEYGGPCLIYMTQREFGQLGKPGWMLAHPLWVAHYTGAPKPATPGDQPWAIWQHRVGPYDPHGLGGYFDVPGTLQLDQNRAAGPLPIAQRVPWGSDQLPASPAAEADDAESWSRLRAEVAARQVDVVGALRDDARAEMTGREIETGEPGGEA